MEEKKIWAVKNGYLVHRDGSIYKLNWNKTKTMRKVKQCKQTNGYFCFHCNGKLTLVHRFVASCFIPNPQNLPEINHKNENKTDNRVENLEWCDGKYNSNYGTRNKRIAKAHKGHTTWNKGKKVYQYNKDGEFVKEWMSLHEIERVLGYNHGYISCCCNGKHKQAYDFVWKYAN